MDLFFGLAHLPESSMPLVSHVRLPTSGDNASDALYGTRAGKVQVPL